MEKEEEVDSEDFIDDGWGEEGTTILIEGETDNEEVAIETV